MRQLYTNSIAVCGSGHTRKQFNSFDAVIHMQESPAHKRFLVGCRPPFMRRTPHGASRLVLAMSPWSVETGRAPSRHCRDARVYGPTTTAMLDDEYTPPHTRTPFPASIFFIRISPVHVSVLAGAKENAVLVSPSHRRDSRYVSREIMHLFHGTVRDDAKQCRSFGAQCLG